MASPLKSGNPEAPRRRVLGAGAALAASWCLPLPRAHAQGEPFPSRPVHIIVPAQSGSPLDVLMHMAAELARAHLDDAEVRIDNRPGAAQTHGAEALTRLARDERHVLAQCVPAWLREPLLREAGYDPATDFRYVVPLAAYPVGIAVRQDSPYDDLPELIEDAGRHPGDISYGTAGIGSAGHLLMEDIGMRQGVRWNPIAMRTAGEVARGVRHGFLDVMVDGATWPDQVDSGAMRLLATFTPERLPRYPDVPTVAELGVGQAYVSPVGLAGPRHLDVEAVRSLHRAFASGKADPTYARHLEAAGLVPLDLDSASFADLMRRTYAQSRQMASALGLRQT
ncbi:tripartite tricarboxylate transporter substrate binding protein [Achromobacter sp. GG226]|uniref:tripartite tricarboxylate transporter substrate binding protein n=1 Tax=Verticiella alkaliphila TaxID=2779529 RepID=UPI001C0D8FF4|nr:tripartite tricarboxylate transporter substrate binding protein [Verticiella sp. GG226]MBU4612984.1 tripartite tricarboxylate transporter substrate binding protein [Verticiella sp. GG226]